MSLIRFYSYIIVFLFLGPAVAWGQTPITLTAGDICGMQGDVICVDITAEDFVNISSTQFVIRFDPKVLCYDTLLFNTSELNQNGTVITIGQTSEALPSQSKAHLGYINLTWFDGDTNGKTISEGGIFMTICFKLIGDPCDESQICVAQSGQIPFEVIQVQTDGSELEIGVEVDKGDVIIKPSEFGISETHCSSDDNGNTGSITFSPYGGVEPYSWNILETSDNGSGVLDCESVTVPDLAPGTYTVFITDANGTSRNVSITIQTNSDFPFLVELDGINPTCFDRENGRVFVDTIYGNSGPYTYEWSTFEFLEDEIKKLKPGLYSLTITDTNGCTATAEHTLVADTLKLEVNIISHPTCEGSFNGLVSITGEGGVPYPGNDYTFEIDGKDNGYFANSNPTNPFTVGNIPEGTFVVVVKDNAASTCVSDPVCFTLEAAAFADIEMTVQDVACHDECNGEISIDLGATGMYTIEVTGPLGPVVGNVTPTSFDSDALCEGDYTVLITETEDDCTLDTMFTILQPSELRLIVIDSMGPGCGGGDGFASLDGVGGTTPFSYEWQDGNMSQDRINMEGGNYSVTITDDNGCRDSVSFVFGTGGDIGLNAFVSQAISCVGVEDGSVSASVIATEDFTFTWQDDNGMNIGSGEIINNLGTGFYYVTATDGMCVDTDTVFLVDGPKPSVDIVQVDPSCIDSDDGTLTAFPVNGTTPFEYEWTEPPSTDILSAGPVLFDGVGIYNLHITDNQGCEIDTLVEMLPPTNAIMVDVSNITGTPCFGQCLGQATFTASGGPAGTGSYTYVISNIDNPVSAGNMLNFSFLCPDMQWVYVIDGLCASDTVFFNVPDGDELIITDQSIIEPPSCDGGDDGMITLDLSGGNPSSYDIFWVNEMITGPTLTGLTTGEYIAEITDGNNCVFIDTIVLVTPDPLTVDVNPFTTLDINCFSSTMGRIGLAVSGGNSGSLTYDWVPNVSSTDFAENLGPGLYEVTVTDSKGCTDETFYELTSAEPISAVIPTPDLTDCFGGQACVGVESASGGVGSNYTFTINNGPRFPLDTCLNLFAGPYFISVFDSAGCAFDTMLTIDQPAEITVDAGDDVTIDLGDESDPVSAFIVSELDIDSIIWTPMEDLECNTLDCQVVTFSPNATSNYTVTVIDVNGCMASDNITVFVDLTRNVYLANIFSPNGDNRNDLFQVVTGFGVETVLTFSVYDRWGNMIFVDENYMPDDSVHPGWDGYYKGSLMDPGVYVYYAEVLFEDGVRVQYKGDVTLVR